MNNAGLPGTGLGGLFYVLLALWMPVAELRATLRGRSSPARWRAVGAQFALACGIIAAVAGTLVIYTHLVDVPGAAGVSGRGLAMASIALAALLLVTLVVVLRIWSALLRRRSETPTSRRAAATPSRVPDRSDGTDVDERFVAASHVHRQSS